MAAVLLFIIFVAMILGSGKFQLEHISSPLFFIFELLFPDFLSGDLKISASRLFNCSTLVAISSYGEINASISFISPSQKVGSVWRRVFAPSLFGTAVAVVHPSSFWGVMKGLNSYAKSQTGNPISWTSPYITDPLQGIKFRFCEVMEWNQKKLQDASIPALQKTIDYACGAGADCGPILQNGACYNPNTVLTHCSYAANSYYQRKGQAQGACDFSGTATLTTTDPRPRFSPPFPFYQTASAYLKFSLHHAIDSDDLFSRSAAGTGGNGAGSSTQNSGSGSSSNGLSPPQGGAGSIGGVGSLGPSGTSAGLDGSDAGYLPNLNICSLFLMTAFSGFDNKARPYTPGLGQSARPAAFKASRTGEAAAAQWHPALWQCRLPAA
ncbi:Glucan endo-1,3-beta-glucosidase-like protein 3 [Platanthera zijinensis]|uniref:Glucan endo-1,3-beta-glucosidase-like protein 3 n=1 Tax=Platanthera zijinensis TaxID=2320716 RepID=A0AAP0FXY0_9ASPA